MRKKRKKSKKKVKNRIIRDTSTHFEEEENHYKLKRVSNFWKNNYIEYESNCGRNSNLSLQENLNKIKPCLN